MILKSLRVHFNTALAEHYPETEINSFFNLLTENILKMKRIDVTLNLYAVVSGKKCEKYETAIKQLKAQTPIQYIIGDTEFYGLPFKVNASTLIPRPETEELVDWIIKEQVSNNEISILDIGTGSGCIAISLAKNIPNAKVYALDVSAEALKTAKQNAELNNVSIEFIQTDILNSHHTELVSVLHKFDIIVSNPPYVRNLEKVEMKANVLNHEPHLALFVEDDEALVFYKAISEFAQQNLKKDGQLYFEINQYLGDEIKTLLSDYKFENIELKKDIFENDRMIKGNKN
jgi:release factor glutamine methyltransferase